MVEATTKTREFEFELVAPEKIEVASMEERVTLPGEMGNFMVLIGHAPLLAGLRPGVITLHRSVGDKHYFITGGFADVGNDHCTVMTPHITALVDLNLEKLAKEIDTAEKALSEVEEKHEQEHLQEKLEILRLKMEAAKVYAGGSVN